MISSTANAIVMVVFGFFIGLTYFIIGTISLRWVKKVSPHLRKIRSGGAKEGKPVTRLNVSPFPIIVSTCVWSGVVAIMILTVIFTPLWMDWWSFLFGVFASFAISSIIFSLAKMGKLKFED